MWGSDLLMWTSTRRKVHLAATRSCKLLPRVPEQIMYEVEARFKSLWWEHTPAKSPPVHLDSDIWQSFRFDDQKRSFTSIWALLTYCMMNIICEDHSDQAWRIRTPEYPSSWGRLAYLLGGTLRATKSTAFAQKRVHPCSKTVRIVVYAGITHATRRQGRNTTSSSSDRHISVLSTIWWGAPGRVQGGTRCIQMVTWDLPSVEPHSIGIK